MTTATSSPRTSPRAVVRIGPSWIQVAALVVAVAFATGALVYFLDHREQSPNAADIGFIDDMILHHQQAVSMSFAFVRRADPGQIANTAEEIIMSQSGDLRMMSRWRGAWPESDGNEEGTVMAWMGMRRPLQAMPGFAAEADVAKLGTLTARALDDHFTTLMIRHHFGGIHMAEAAEQRVALDEVRAFARGVVILQRREIDEINLWRASADLAEINGL